jgi:GTP-binding protein
MRAPVIAVVGRPNVGKSTLFNRLAGRRISIVDDTPGVTRDRLYADAILDDMRFTIIDTGGFEADPDTQLFHEIRTQSQLAIEEADALILTVDARAGVTPADIEVARLLRRSGKPLVIAANKVDAPQHKDFTGELYSLGIPEVWPMSAAHGTGIEAMLERLFTFVPEELKAGGRESYKQAMRESGEFLDDEAIERALDEVEAATGEALDNDDPSVPDESTAGTSVVAMPEVLRVAVIGKPNAGKSSLINKLLGEDRHLVSNIAGTTMDAVDSFVEYNGHRFRLIDTAGIRRKRAISHRIEKYAVVAALKGMDRADVTLLVVDAVLGITEQDMKVGAFAHDKGKAIILVVNKWDLAKENGMDADTFAKNVRDRMPFLAFAPLRFVSAKTGRKVFELLDTVDEIAREHFKRVPTGALNRVVRDAVEAHNPPVDKGRRVKIFYGTQVTVAPPTFVFATNAPEAIHFSYRRYLQNQIREAFGYTGAPIRLIFRKRGDEAGRKENLQARKRTAARTTPRRRKTAR